MSERGYFAVDRSIWDHPGFAPEKYSEREAWLWLISSAAWEPRRVRIGRATFVLERGQCVFALRFLAEKWRWSDSRVRRFLDRRAADAAVVVIPTRTATLITICNYDNYQSPRRADVSEIEAPSNEKPTADRRKEKEINTNQSKNNSLSEGANEVSEGKQFPTSSPLSPGWRPNGELCEQVKQAFGMTDDDLRTEVVAFHAHNASQGILSKNWNSTFLLFCKRWREHRDRQPAPRMQLTKSSRNGGSYGSQTNPGNLVDIARRNTEFGISFGPKPTGLPANTRQPASDSAVRVLSEGGSE